MVGEGHSPVPARVPTDGGSRFVEADPSGAGGLKTVAGFGGVEVVFDGGQDLEPQLPGNDDTLGSTVASEGDRLGTVFTYDEMRAEPGV